VVLSAKVSFLVSQSLSLELSNTVSSKGTTWTKTENDFPTEKLGFPYLKIREGVQDKQTQQVPMITILNK
jgi:hypothetical protein